MASSDQEQITLPPELAQIEAEAKQLEPAPIVTDQQAATGEPVAAPVDYQEDAALLVGMLFEGCGELYPSTMPVLAPRQTRFTAALGKVMEKRQWSLAAILGRWGAEIELAFVASTMALPLAKAIQIDRSAARLEQQKVEVINRPADPQPVRPADDPYSKLAEQQSQQ
jgi:hypothetical protein